MANTKTEIHCNTQIHDLTPPELGSGNLTSEIAPSGGGWDVRVFPCLGAQLDIKKKKKQDTPQVQILNQVHLIIW